MKAFWIAAVLVLAVSVLAVAAWWVCTGSLDAGMFGGVVGGLVAAIATLALIWLGMRQIQGLAKTTNADFILRRVDQFFRAETRTLLHLIEDDYLRFHEEKPFRNSYFIVDEQKLAGLHDDVKAALRAKRAYSTYEIDDLVLGPIEDLGSLEANGLISFDLIYDIFSWYICRAWQNAEIQHYLRGTRTERGEAADVYNYFASLAKRCLAREPT